MAPHTTSTANDQTAGEIPLQAGLAVVKMAQPPPRSSDIDISQKIVDTHTRLFGSDYPHKSAWFADSKTIVPSPVVFSLVHKLEDDPARDGLMLRSMEVTFEHAIKIGDRVFLSEQVSESGDARIVRQTITNGKADPSYLSVLEYGPPQEISMNRMRRYPKHIGQPLCFEDLREGQQWEVHGDANFIDSSLGYRELYNCKGNKLPLAHFLSMVEASIGRSNTLNLMVGREYHLSIFGTVPVFPTFTIENRVLGTWDNPSRRGAHGFARIEQHFLDYNSECFAKRSIVYAIARREPF